MKEAASLYLTFFCSLAALAFLVLSGRGWKKAASFPLPVEIFALSPTFLIVASAAALRLGFPPPATLDSLALALCLVASALVWPEYVVLLVRGSSFAYTHNFSDRGFRAILLMMLGVGLVYAWLFWQVVLP